MASPREVVASYDAPEGLVSPCPHDCIHEVYHRHQVEHDRRLSFGGLRDGVEDSFEGITTPFSRLEPRNHLAECGKALVDRVPPAGVPGAAREGGYACTGVKAQLLSLFMRIVLRS